MVLSKEKTHDDFQHLKTRERRFRSVCSVGFGLYRCPTHLSPSPKHLKLNPKPPTNYGADPNAWARDVRGPRDPIYLHLFQLQGPISPDGRMAGWQDSQDGHQ